MSIVIGYKGVEVPLEVTAAAVTSKLVDLEVKVTSLLAKGTKLPVRKHEVDFLKKWYEGIASGKVKGSKAIKGLAALPTQVGNVHVLSKDLGIALGVLITHRRFQGSDGEISYSPIVGVQRPGTREWLDLHKVLAEMGVDPRESGWIAKVQGIAYAVCPGYALVTPAGEVVDYHSCGTMHLASEGWHGYRCPTCQKHHKVLRGTTGGGAGVTSKEAITAMANKLLKGELTSLDEF
jgi:hypothetical protein